MSDERDQQVDKALGGVNFFAAITERLFSRFYRGLNRRSAAQKEREKLQRRRDELEDKIARARRVAQRNKQLKQALKQRDDDVQRLGGILSALDEGIIMQDTEGRIVYMNKSARDLLGNQKNFWQSDLGMLFEAHREVQQIDSEIVPLGDPQRVQVNGLVLGAQLAAVANDAGERLGTMIVLRDVTQAALADRLKDQFATAISHELKTPMTVIKGMSEVLKSQPDDRPPNRRLLETLSRNVDILDRMVVELLDVSEMGADAFDIRQDEVNLERLLWSVVRGAEPEIKKGRLDVMVMLRDVADLVVQGDAERLRWALGHLLQNSVAYTESGGHIRLSAGLDDNDRRFIRVDFADTGVGIAQKDVPHIFDRFYRGDPRDPSGRLVDPRGLGQGLYIARTVAEAHGGYLGLLKTGVGDGSMFTMVLPIHDIQQLQSGEHPPE
ncbi:MAG: PAS domain-containing protein [Anaerolineaceae bacterium]|nr:MAG: PAS domain-containing protein [Anaerolineaceae bacterium]